MHRERRGVQPCRIVTRSWDRQDETCDKPFSSMTPFSDSLKRKELKFCKSLAKTPGPPTCRRGRNPHPFGAQAIFNRAPEKKEVPWTPLERKILKIVA